MDTAVGQVGVVLDYSQKSKACRLYFPYLTNVRSYADPNGYWYPDCALIPILNAPSLDVPAIPEYEEI